MATYCISDIHGEYETYLRLLEKIGFSQQDTLYLLGDMVDRGPQPLTLVRDVMARENVVALAGNHDLMACLFLRPLIHGGRQQDLDEEKMMEILRWQQDGGASTLREFRALSVDQRREVVEWLEDLELFREVEAGGERYVLVHAGFGDAFDPGRPLDDYSLEDYLFSRPDLSRPGFADKYTVFGHTPTRLLPGAVPNRIFRSGRYIDIDCGCVFGGWLGALCLDTGEEFYVQRREAQS